MLDTLKQAMPTAVATLLVLAYMFLLEYIGNLPIVAEVIK